MLISSAGGVRKNSFNFSHKTLEVVPGSDYNWVMEANKSREDTYEAETVLSTELTSETFIDSLEYHSGDNKCPHCGYPLGESGCTNGLCEFVD